MGNDLIEGSSQIVVGLQSCLSYEACKWSDNSLLPRTILCPDKVIDQNLLKLG